MIGAGLGAASSRAEKDPPPHNKIQWTMQTYASQDLAQHVIKPSIEAFNRAANGEMEIQLYFSDGLVPNDQVFQALQDGRLDAAQSDEQSIGSPLDISVFSGYFPFACRHGLDVPVLFNDWGLNEIWSETYNTVPNITWLGVGAWDPCHLSSVKPIKTVNDLNGLRVFTAHTVGQFLARFGVKPTNLPWDQIKPALQFGDLDGIAWSGITECYTLGWIKFAPYFLSNNISGAWFGSYFANSERWSLLPSHLKELFRLSMDNSHYYRQYWYWGNEAKYRFNGKQHTITTIPQNEWQQNIELEAFKFWNEISEVSTRSAKVIKILRDYSSAMKQAGPPYD